MAVTNPLQPFFWGSGGSVKTPDQVAREREIAAALLQGGVDYSPVDHWLQGAARAAQAGVGALKGRWADEAENAGREGFQSRWDSVFGGGAAPVAADPVAAALVAPQTAADAVNAVGAVPSGTSADYIRQGLLQRGLPEHVADAFILNFKDESGLNPGINEAQPLVPGSRGGYGLYQLTGPRRRAYEQFAAERGVSPDNVDAQLDFLMMELQGPEAKAAQAILSAPDTGTAAAAIVNQFLRPAEEHRARRAAAYMGGAAAPRTTRVAQAGTPDIASLLGLASDPWANDTQRSIIDALVGQQLQQQDPAYQLDLALKQAQLDAALTPAAPKPIEVGGVLLDPVTYQPIFDSREASTPKPIEVGGVLVDPVTFQPLFDSRQPDPGYTQLTPDEAAARNLDPTKAWQVGPDNKVYEIGNSGVNVTTNVAGGNKFDEAFATQDAEALSTISSAGIAAQRNLGRIDQLASLLEQSPSGFGAMLAQRAGEFGIQTEGLDTIQAAQALINSLVPEQRQPGSGPMSDADLELFKQSLPRIINTPQGNQTIINTMRAIAQYDAEGAEIVRRLRAGEIDRSTAFDLLQSRQNPLQGFTAPPPAPAATPSQSTVPASDIDALLQKYGTAQ